MDHTEFNRIALNPMHSVVVEACAGSGKTWLLVSRIIRLLLDGASPSNILAITFTHKAAGEMRTRLYDWLHLCASADDDVVLEFLRERAVPEDELAQQCLRARGLLENLLIAQPSLRIQTFHAWFFELIRCAPLSAGLSSYSLTEQPGALRAQAWAQFTAAVETDSQLTKDMHSLITQIKLSNTRKVLNQFIQQRGDWWAYTEGQSDPAAWAAQQLLAQGASNRDFYTAIQPLDQPEFHAALHDYIAQLALSTDKRQILADTITSIMENGDLSPEQRFDALSGLILTKSKKISLQIKSGTSASAQALYNAHLSVSEALLKVWQVKVDQQLYYLNTLIFRLGHTLLQHYQRVKQQQRVLDFTDIEWQAAQLLANPQHADYMLHKLDTRYQHILLDEFQDTNPLQWRILQTWLQATESAGTHADIFLVGDPKQSIYRFRGAQAGLFQLATQTLRANHAHYLSQHYTRRNAPQIVATLNQCFQQLQHPLFFEHHATEQTRQGHVEVLPIPAPPQDHDPSHRQFCRNPLLLAPFAPEEIQAREQEAQQLVQGIRSMVHHWEIDDAILGTTRLARYDDIMILVRQRTHLDIYETALRQAAIPYVSNRRGGLLDTTEITDILAVLRSLIDENDNLALARVLRSPLFNASDADLQILRQHQLTSGLSSWRNSLRTYPQHTPTLQHAKHCFKVWQSLITQLPVHDLLDRIIHDTQMIARYVAHVPHAYHHSVQANLEAFIQLSLTVSGGRYPSLPRFLDDVTHLQDYPDEHPDEGDSLIGAHAVRIHTVHGAKGLEAPIVWLLDCGGSKVVSQHYHILSHWPADALRPQHFSVLGTQAMRATWQVEAFAHDAEQAKIEALNLLYVAMTRARQVLIVSASKATEQNNWHAIIAAANQALVPVFPFSLQDINVTTGVAALPSTPAEIDDTTALTEPGIQFWPQLSHSIGQKKPPLDERTALGVLVHRLLELATNTEYSALRLNQQFGKHPQWDTAWGICQRIMQAPALQRFFDRTQHLRAHNELTYVRHNGQIGRIDRIVEFEHEIWVLDYKTGLVQSAPELSTMHQTQLNEYRDAMQHCYPNHTIACALICASVDGNIDWVPMN